MAGMTTETDISYAAFESLPDVETTMDSVSSMDDSTMNMLETLRYLPDHTAPNKKLSYTQTPVFFGTLEMQLPTSFNFVAGCAWETSHVEVSNNVLYYRPRQEDTSNTGAFRIAFLLPSEYSIADASKEGGDDDKLPAHDADYKVYLEFETAAHVIKIMTNDQIVILKCPDEPTKAAFVRAVETDLRRLLGDDLWQEKTQAAVQAMPMLRDQFYVLEQRRLRMRQVLSDAGLVAMDVSLQKSFSKLITGHLEMVAPTDADRRGRTYWFVLHDQSLYWFENESADEPISFFNMNLATVALVVDEIRKGRFMLSIQTALRSIELRMPHAIALCEWMAAIEAVLIRCRQEKLERERRRSSSFNRRPHAKRMSTFTKLIRGGNGKLLNTPTEEPLLENDPVTFKHESQSDRSLRIFEAIASMRESGYTVDELMARPNGRKLFLTFLRDTSRLALSQSQ